MGSFFQVRIKYNLYYNGQIYVDILIIIRSHSQISRRLSLEKYVLTSFSVNNRYCNSHIKMLSRVIKLFSMRPTIKDEKRDETFIQRNHLGKYLFNTQEILAPDAHTSLNF